MKKVSILFIALVGLFAAVSVEAAGTIDWGSPVNRSMLTSASQPWGSGFRVEMGSFKTNFAPTATNTAQWATNWVPAQRTGYDIANSRFTSSYTFTNNPAPFTNGAKVYIWGFNGSEVSSEWFLANKTEWKWFNAGDNLPPKLFSTGSAQALVGTINTNTNAPFHIQTAAITNAMLPPTSWPQWTEDNLPGVPNPQPSEDNNTNSITDAWEYTLHDGNTPNPGQWLQVAEAGGGKYLEMHIPRRRDRNASYTVEVTTDLVNGPWESGPAYTDVIDSNPAALVVRDKTPIGQGGDKRFMRVKVAVTP